MAKTEKKPKTETPFRTVIQNLPFHNFEEKRKLVCMYKDTVTLGEEEETFQANVFVDLETGEEKYVQNSYSIAKAIKQAKAEFQSEITNTVFEIDFLGKTTVKGKPFNQFKIGYCPLQEWEEFCEN